MSIWVYKDPKIISQEDSLKYISIDPADKHFTVRVELRHRETQKVKLVFCEVKKFRSKNENVAVNRILIQLNEYLGSILEYTKGAYMILVERQLPKNYHAVRISQHVLSYFVVNQDFGSSIVIEVDSRLKTKIFGFGSNTEYKTKRLAVKKAKELCVEHDDMESLKMIEDNKPNKKLEKKDDDISDVIVMLEAVLIFLSTDE